MTDSPRARCEGSVFWWCFTLDPAKLRVPTARVYDALLAEGVKAEHGYP
jgi:hypothetical protein